MGALPDRPALGRSESAWRQRQSHYCPVEALPSQGTRPWNIHADPTPDTSKGAVRDVELVVFWIYICAP